MYSHPGKCRCGGSVGVVGNTTRPGFQTTTQRGTETFRAGSVTKSDTCHKQGGARMGRFCAQHLKIADSGYFFTYFILSGFKTC